MSAFALWSVSASSGVKSNTTLETDCLYCQSIMNNLLRASGFFSKKFSRYLKRVKHWIKSQHLTFCGKLCLIYVCCALVFVESNFLCERTTEYVCYQPGQPCFIHILVTLFVLNSYLALYLAAHERVKDVETTPSVWNEKEFVVVFYRPAIHQHYIIITLSGVSLS